MHGSTGRTLARLSTVALVGAAALALSGCSLLQGLTGGDGVVEGEGESTDVFTIAVGDCLNDAAAGDSVSAVPIVDCAEPHDSEVYHGFDMPDGDFPGQSAIDAAIETGCLPTLEAFVGTPYDTSLVEYGSYSPSEDTWATGDREILCVAFELDAEYNPIQTSGSLEGSGK